MYTDIKKINWIARALSNCDIPCKQIKINRYFSKIAFYGKVFQLINQLFGLHSISISEVKDKACLCNLDAIHVDNIIKNLISSQIAEISQKGSNLEIVFPNEISKVFIEIFDKKLFGELSELEVLFLEILDHLTIKPLTSDQIYNNTKTREREFFNFAIESLVELGIIDELTINNETYYLTPLKTYGNHQKYMDYCKKHNSDEISTIAELLDFCESHKGIPFGLLPNNLKETSKICLDLGILHGVNYEYGNIVGDLNFTLIFPTSEIFDMIKKSVNDFDKIQASIGLLVYGVYFNPHKIINPERYISSLIEREELRATTLNLDDKIKQFNPSIFAGIVDITKGYSEYLTHFGNLRTFPGLIPKLIPSEDNREALRTGLRLFQDNDEFTLNDSNKRNNIFEKVFYYADTAAISTYKLEKKSLAQQELEEIFGLIKSGR